MLLLDAYNILHARAALPPRLAGVEVPGLVHLIGRSRYAGRPVRIVCDGRRPPTDRAAALRSGEERVTLGPAEIWYAGEGRDADGLIERILREDSAARRMLVVSSDRRLQRAASRARADFLASETFLRQLAQDETARRELPLPEFATAIPLDSYSVGHWIREFGVGEDWLGIRSADGEESRPTAGSAPRIPAPASQEAVPQPLRPEPPKALPAQAAGPPEASGWVREALRLWGDRLHLDDLDMRKWLGPGPADGGSA